MNDFYLKIYNVLILTLNIKLVELELQKSWAVQNSKN